MTLPTNAETAQSILDAIANRDLKHAPPEAITVATVYALLAIADELHVVANAYRGRTHLDDTGPESGLPRRRTIGYLS